MREEPLPRDGDERSVETNYIEPEERFLGAQSKNSHLEAFAEVKLAADRIVDEKILGAFALDATIEN